MRLIPVGEFRCAMGAGASALNQANTDVYVCHECDATFHQNPPSPLPPGVEGFEESIQCPMCGGEFIEQIHIENSPQSGHYPPDIDMIEEAPPPIWSSPTRTPSAAQHVHSPMSPMAALSPQHADVNHRRIVAEMASRGL